MLQNAVTISDLCFSQVCLYLLVACWGASLRTCEGSDVLRQSPQRCANIFRPPVKTASLFGMKNCRKKNKRKKNMKSILYHTVSTCKILQRSCVLSAQVTILQGTRSCPVLPKFLWVCLHILHFVVGSDDQQFEFRVHGIRMYPVSSF